ncbi:hypothetical protein EV44_g3739 [Erysiphe necator]|uniref:Uncharacterized protein n=1 Tax=Uncinula necator TaxID=52586 RepID=A0A0B1P052_UNCNE|nr:hypothetical protein EV44_g3739 [Erysiphe necator]
MVQSTFDPCLLYTRKSDLFGVVGIQTDNTLFISNDNFISLENNEIIKAKIITKPVEKLLPNNQIIFNGGIIIHDGASIFLKPKKQGDKICLVDIKSPLFQSEYVAQRARGAYIATVCQPEAAFDLSFAAQSVQNPSYNDMKLLNKQLQWQIENKDKGLRFININLSQAKLFVFVDASFANNKDLSSQIGFVIALVDETNNNNDRYSFKISDNLLHWSSIKCKRVTRSILASELYATVHGVDSGIIEDEFQEDDFETGTHFSYDFRKLNGIQILTHLEDQSVRYLVTKSDRFEELSIQEAQTNVVFSFDGRYNGGVFQGIVPDKGAAGVSTVGKLQFRALQILDPAICLDTAPYGEQPQSPLKLDM